MALKLELEPCGLIENQRTLPPIRWDSLDRLTDSHKILLVTTPAAELQFNPVSSGFNIVDRLHVADETQKTVNEMLRYSGNTIETVFAVGGGRAIDIAKLLAYRWDKPLIAIPTIISTDAFLVNSTGVRTDGCVTYIQSKKPDLVLLDMDLLKQAPYIYHVSGCGDVLSIYTALFDWKYANLKGIVGPEEIYSNSVASMSKGILDGLMSEEKEIKKGSRKGLMPIINSLAMEVQLCNLYGNSRPEEGGEHFFTYAIENKLKNFLHGEMVSFSILLTAFIQGQDINRIKSFMNAIGLQYLPKGLKRPIVLETLNQMQAYVKMYHLRYSIYNDLSLEKIEKLDLEKFFSLIQLH